MFVVNRQPRQVIIDDVSPVQTIMVQPSRPTLGNIRCYTMEDQGPAMSFQQQSSNNYGVGGGGLNFMSVPLQQQGSNNYGIGGGGLNFMSVPLQQQGGNNYGFGGGGLNFMSAPLQQQTPARRIVYNANVNPTVSCEIRPDHPQQEYVLTTVDGTNSAGGTYPRGSAPPDDDDVDDIEISDGRDSPVENSGGGSGFYPTLPTYDEADRKY